MDDMNQTPQEKYTCKCGHVTHSKDELKKHNKEVHGDEMAEAVDQMENENEKKPQETNA